LAMIPVPTARDTTAHISGVAVLYGPGTFRTTRNADVQKGQGKLQEGSRTVQEAIELLDSVHLPGEPERRARNGLGILRSAVDWLEDSDHFDHAHKVLDDAGRLVRTTFGCKLTFEPGKGYSQTCPVALAHNRVGNSTGSIIEESECSICQEDPEDCDHIAGQVYGDEVCGRVTTKADLLEVSLVSRPKQPDARIDSVSIIRDELERELGSEFRYGMPVSCDKCLQECNGMVDAL